MFPPFSLSPISFGVVELMGVFFYPLLSANEEGAKVAFLAREGCINAGERQNIS